MCLFGYTEKGGGFSVIHPSLIRVIVLFLTSLVFRAIYFGAYDTAKQFAGEKPSILKRFGIAQVNIGREVKCLEKYDLTFCCKSKPS